MEQQPPIAQDTASLPKNGHSKIRMISSNTTLFWRIFMPFFGTMVISCFTVAFIYTPDDDMSLPFVPVIGWKIFIGLLWALWIYFVWRALWRFKRIEADDTHIYVSNYWTTVRYPREEVARWEEKKRLGRRVVNMWLKAPGRFGQKISFLPGSNYRSWQDNKPAFISAN